MFFSRFRFVGICLAVVLCGSWNVKGQDSNLTCLAPILNDIDPDAPEDLNQAFMFGPWKRPVVRDGMGTVNFPYSGKSAEIFDQGMAFWHAFAYQEAERCFRACMVDDPSHPMPYWGLAFANERRPKRAAFFAKEAEKRLHNRGDLLVLEREWLKLVVNFSNYKARVRELDRMAFAHPDNVEMAAALLRQVVVDRYWNGRSITSYYANNLLADRIAKLEPKHPSRHLRLFLWLGREPSLALPFAPDVPLAAPEVPQMWRYSAETFRASGEMALAEEYDAQAVGLGLSSGTMPDEAGDLVSHFEVYVEDLTLAGKFKEARKAARELVGLPRTFYREKRHAFAERQAGSFSTGRKLLGQLHLRLEKWTDLLEECERGVLAPVTEDPVTEIESMFWKGIAYYNLGKPDEAAAMVSVMSDVLKAAKGKGVTTDAETFMVRLTRTLRSQISGDAPDDVTWLPTEYLARMYSNYQVHPRKSQFLPTAVYCELNHKAGNMREVLLAFDGSFRTSASRADADLPVLDRLDEMAAGMRVGGAWKLPAPKGKDLAPVKWLPTPAPDFSQPDASGTLRTLKDFGEKPVILNFFLGAGCGFCRQQMDKFTPVLPLFEASGIQIVGITTDDLPTLQTVIDSYKKASSGADNLYAFPVLSDATAIAFKAFGVFDEFTGRPLHGTILLDSSGRVLWRNVGHEPFNHPIPLLREAERLLSIYD